MAVLKPESLLDAFQTEEKDGLYAEIDNQERVTHFGFYKETPIYTESYTLNVDYANSTSLVERLIVHRFSPEDLDEEDTRTDDERYVDWVTEWVERIHESNGNYTATCDFCHQDQTDSRRIIAGPRVHICAECVDLAAAIIQDMGTGINGGAR
jgi:hypothetical protein